MASAVFFERGRHRGARHEFSPPSVSWASSRRTHPACRASASSAHSRSCGKKGKPKPKLKSAKFPAFFATWGPFQLHPGPINRLGLIPQLLLRCCQEMWSTFRGRGADGRNMICWQSISEAPRLTNDVSRHRTGSLRDCMACGQVSGSNQCKNCVPHRSPVAGGL